MKLTTQLSALSIATTLMLAGCGDPTPGTPTTPPPPETPKFSVDVSVDKAVVMQGQTLQMKATVTRSAGFTDAVQVQISGLPDGVSAPAVMIPAGATEADVLLTAIGAAPHSLPTAVNAKGTAGSASANKAFTVTVRGAAGVVDTSFAGGHVVTPVDAGEDYANTVVVQADGKVIVAGSSSSNVGTRISLVRYQRDGSVDTTFGTAGKVITAVGTKGNDSAAAIALQRDGKIVVAGASDQAGTGLDFAVLRYNADGSLDATFGNAGKRTVDFAGDADRAWALLIQADDKIVVGGEASLGTTTSGVDFALVRLNVNGSLDAGFGAGGKLTTPIKSNAGTDVVRALALQTVGGEQRLLAIGGEGDFQAARYTPAGALDAGFGNAGKIVGLFGSNIGSARAVVVLPGGEAVIAGHSNHHFAVAQLTLAGQLDNRFGSAGSGKFEFSIVNNWNEATSLVRQADGKLVVGGWAYIGAGSSADFAALRIGADGLLDGTFATAGVALTPMAGGTKSDQSHALILQADERVPTVRAIQAGEANGSNNDFAVLRLWL
jgi:uncharacterized delta-60 repeat protein